MIWVVRTFLGAAGTGVFLLLAGLFLPSKTEIDSAMFIARPAATVYALASDTRWVAEWAPWSLGQSGLLVEFSDAKRGQDAQVRWRDGDGREGSQTIRLATPYAVVISDLDFGPRGMAVLVVSIDELSDGVQVTLRYEADHGLNIVGRYAGLAAQRDVRAVIEQSLVALRAQAEGLPEADFSGALIVQTQMDARAIVFAERGVRGDAAAQDEAFAEALSDVQAFMRRRGQEPSGPPMAMTLEWNPPLWRFRAAAPYVGRRGEDGTSVLYGETEGGLTIQATHRGDTRQAAGLYEQLDAYIAANRLEQAGPVREILVTDRNDSAPEDMVTEIEIPVRPID